MIAYQVPIGGYRRQQARHHGRVAAAGQGDGQMVDETDGQHARQEKGQGVLQGAPRAQGHPQDHDDEKGLGRRPGAGGAARQDPRRAVQQRTIREDKVFPCGVIACVAHDGESQVRYVE